MGRQYQSAQYIRHMQHLMQLFVQMDKNQENIFAEITDYCGRTVASFNLENLNTPISVIKLEKGSYHLKLITSEGIQAMTRFIKN